MPKHNQTLVNQSYEFPPPSQVMLSFQTTVQHGYIQLTYIKVLHTSRIFFAFRYHKLTAVLIYPVLYKILLVYLSIWYLVTALKL